jgi:hypothetical protein
LDLLGAAHVAEVVEDADGYFVDYGLVAPLLEDKAVLVDMGNEGQSEFVVVLG